MKAKPLGDIVPKFNSKFFFDTNIWLYLFYPQSSKVTEKVITQYSQLFENVLSKKCLIVTDVIQIAEIVNHTLHEEHRSFKKKAQSGMTFKEFREQNDYSVALDRAKTLTNSILKQTTLRGGIFSDEELRIIVSKCHLADFNDIYFANFCKKEEAILITHDFDFAALEGVLELYTANQKYLS